MISIENIRLLAGHARETHEAAATRYAVRLSQLAALLVRAQKPTAALLVFDQDEETVSADTTIEIVSVRDANGADLGELDWAVSDEVRGLISTAYDSSPGFYPGASQDIYDTESIGGPWQDHNLLELHIDVLLTDPTLFHKAERPPDMFDAHTGTPAPPLDVIVRQTDHPRRTAHTLHETWHGVDEPGQTYTLIRTYATTGGSRVRVTVHIDDHHQQSRLLAEAWDDKGWREVVRILGQDPLVAGGLASGYLPRERNDEKRRSLERFAHELLRRCLQVIAYAPFGDDDTVDDLTRALRAAEHAVEDNSSGEVVEALQNALRLALARWPDVTSTR